MNWYRQVKTAMTATEGIGKLQQLKKTMADKVSEFDKEVSSVESQWVNIGRVGGQREETAARLLSTLRPSLQGIMTFASICESMIGTMMAQAGSQGVTKTASKGFDLEKMREFGLKAPKKDRSEYDQEEMRMGIEVEKEHTNDEDVCAIIAANHLDEIKDYYTRLKKMESEADA